MRGGVVSHGSGSPAHPPYATIALTLLCLFLHLSYSSLSPILQQALIDMGGMQPSLTAALLRQPIPTWWSPEALLVYLWVFGIKVEQRLGSIATLAVFLAGGALANVIVALRLPGLVTPIIGASGAVSAVVGAYLGLFPARHIGLFLPLGLYLQFARVPALFVIGSWFTLQLLYTAFGPINAAVAWWTHLAGFVLGISFALAARGLSLLRHQAGPSIR